MKRLKKFIRLCGLILFMALATAGIGILGVAPILTKDRKLFVDMHPKTELVEKAETDQRVADNLF
ncbi:hypothetical protein ACCC92_09130 [Mucilaginibacter sp. Mucisp84]|uniref:hypothetical protein n=1 Tax=Mucilaginibacter sp. Mucisp84 TaxID=3243058 RepID=UPI0039A41675